MGRTQKKINFVPAADSVFADSLRVAFELVVDELVLMLEEDMQRVDNVSLKAEVSRERDGAFSGNFKITRIKGTLTNGEPIDRWFLP